MKVISVNNQQSQNRPMSFKGLEKMIAGKSNRQGNYFTSFAVELTSGDLKKYGSLLAAFPLKLQQKVGRNVPANVVQIGIKRHGFAGDAPFALSVNHTDVYDSGTFVEQGSQHLGLIRKLLQRALGDKDLSIVQSVTERRQMKDVLLGDTGFTFEGDENALGIGGVQHVVGIMKRVLKSIPTPEAKQ